jgi:Tfp pilus assembly protein PilP
VGKVFPLSNAHIVYNEEKAMSPFEITEILSTSQAAEILNRKPQTLRKWACLENGPIKPLRVNGRLAWRVEDLRALLINGNSSLATNKSLSKSTR